jgi:hypothetical protein
MSHFFTLVVVNSETEVESLLAPFDEELQVEEYDRE